MKLMQIIYDIRLWY